MNIAEMLALIAVGYVLKRLIKSEKPFDYLRILVNDFLLALFIFGNVASKDLAYLLSIKTVFLYVFLIIAISLSTSYLYGRIVLKNDPWAGALMVLSVYPNTAALGFPIASLFLDDITPAILYSTTNSMIVIPIVTFIAAHYSSGGANVKESFLKALKFPPTVANLLALALIIAGVRIPSQILEPIRTVGWLSIPLLLIYFGSRITLRSFDWRRLAEVGLFRIVIPFAFVFLTLRWAAPDVFYSVLVEASMPPAIAANAILAQYRLKAEEAISVTFVLTMMVIGLFMALSALVG
ncbi:permease, Auxin efflux carrier protein-like protein [Thermococcus cleftensis]|uniref:Permease, Auxin efflux carrier protein-like protein n=1 Tax=Thermococcus cleftensis (strain DSM 27260 / KACC 17922 / CL1) TaxID=163003 RepID=I3ZRF4_THECF|nr:AEC family transporter [Thermococcus cleftensis]AFL94288.1 permease, Auxin efflux carrier protein-like protein [Thermococcus cleftensis]